MKINIIFLKKNKGFSQKEEREIKNIIIDTATHAARILNLKSENIINYIVYPFDKDYIGGFTQAKDFIILSIQPKEFNREELKSIIYHEMHHVKRDFCGYTKRKISLLEALFSEGLATVFEMEQVPNRIPRHSRYTDSLIKEWLPRLREQDLVSSKFSYDDWFLGAGEKPRQLGFKIGTYLIHQIQKNHSKITLESLTRKNAQNLLILSREKLLK